MFKGVKKMQIKHKAWDSAWETVYQNQEWGKYPPEELIRFIAGNYSNVENKKSIRILDIGCGTGAASWYLAREGFEVFGVDGSTTAIKHAKKRFANENLSGIFSIGDISSLNYPNDFFDAVIDIVAIQHNKYSNIVEIINEVQRVLKPNGMFFSMMTNTSSYGYGLGNELEKNTFESIKFGPYAGKGVIHFFDSKDIQNLFSIFQHFSFEISARTINNQRYIISHYTISAIKRDKTI